MRGGAPRVTSPQAPIRLMCVSHWSDRLLENLTVDQRMPAQEAPRQDRRTLSLGCSRVGTPPRSSVLTCSIISEENRRSPSMHAPAYGSQHKDARRSRCFTALAYIAFRISSSTSCDRKNLKKKWVRTGRTAALLCTPSHPSPSGIQRRARSLLRPLCSCSFGSAAHPRLAGSLGVRTPHVVGIRHRPSSCHRLRGQGGTLKSARVESSINTPKHLQSPNFELQLKLVTIFYSSNQSNHVEH
jgi:hypothetical protein